MHFSSLWEKIKKIGNSKLGHFLWITTPLAIGFMIKEIRVSQSRGRDFEFPIIEISVLIICGSISILFFHKEKK